MAPLRVSMFGSRLSPFVEKVARALAFKKVAFDLVEPKEPADFDKWNPQTKKMPAAYLNGELVYDSTFILRRLDEIVPEPPLFAADPVTAAAQRLLEDWSDESLYWHGMALRWTKKNRATTARQIFASLSPVLRLIAHLVVARQIRRTTLAQGMGRLPYDVLVSELARQLDNLIVALAERPFFYADRPSAGDLAVYGQLRMLCSGPTPEADALIRDRSALVQYMGRVEAATGGP